MADRLKDGQNAILEGTSDLVRTIGTNPHASMQAFVQILQELFKGLGLGGLINTFNRFVQNQSINMSSIPNDGTFDSAAALRTARTDNATLGDCAKGVANILQRQGFSVTRGHAHEWKDSLLENGWVRLEGIKPEEAPEGAVLVYDKDRKPRNNGGGKYGHVEIVSFDNQGNRLYVSDRARTANGGTVPDNFVGAYIPAERLASAVLRHSPDSAPADSHLAEKDPGKRTTSVDNRAREPESQKISRETISTRNTSVASTLEDRPRDRVLSDSFSAAVNPDLGMRDPGERQEMGGPQQQGFALG